jgi:hypothetical protein
MNPDTAALSQALAFDFFPFDQLLYPGQFGFGQRVPVGHQTV